MLGPTAFSPPLLPHHLVHWTNGGATNLENCVLLCKRHNCSGSPRRSRGGAEGGWNLIRAEGKIVAIAPTMTFALARGPD